jgi:hypothetical protein
VIARVLVLVVGVVGSATLLVAFVLVVGVVGSAPPLGGYIPVLGPRGTPGGGCWGSTLDE